MNMDIIRNIVSILVALISAIALIKVNKIDNQDRIRRSLWAVEQYLLALGKYIENPIKENLENYTAFYFLCSFYAEETIRRKLQNIDLLVSRNNLERAKTEVVNLIITYSRIYKMAPYSPRKKRFKWI